MRQDTRHWDAVGWASLAISVVSIAVMVDIMTGSVVSEWARGLASGAMHWRCRHELDQERAAAYEDGWRKGYSRASRELLTEEEGETENG